MQAQIEALESENAALKIQVREGQEQQTATAEVLGVINASPGDLVPVFEAMLQKALRLCEAEIGVLWTYDGELMHPTAIRSPSPEYAKFLRESGPRQPTEPQRPLLRGESFVQVADLTKTQAYQDGDPLARAFVDLGGFRTVLNVALRKENKVLGLFAIYRTEISSFSDKQVALLQNFAAQAVIAMENARLITETREALEQQTATAEVLGVINSSPGDLAPVFDAILEKAMRLCEAAFGDLYIFDGEQCHTAAVRGASPAYIEARRRTPPDPKAAGTVSARILETKRPVHVADITAEEAHRDGLPSRRVVSEFGVRTILSVPLLQNEGVVGFIMVYRQEVRPFTDKQIALLQNFAAQAVIAMENARLITETREALEQQTATAAVLGVINSSPGDLAPVFDAMLEKATRLCEAAFGVLWIHEDGSFRASALRGVPTAYAEFVRREPRGSSPGGALGRLARGERLVHIPDTDAEGTRGDTMARTLTELGGIRTLLAVPLRKEAALVGAFTIYRQEARPFTDKQISLLESFAAQAVIAMENARLLGELRQRTEEVAELNRGLEARVAEQVAELGRVGRLKRFLAPQLAELIVSQGDEKILESHRREIVVVFCDLRGYTAFTETAEPEEVLDFLREYHGALGPLVSRFEGTLDQFSGDGIMVFFNDPVPIPDPAERAVKMAVVMRETAGALISSWRGRGRELGFGVGIAQGYATLGQIGFAERSGYTAIGTVCNLAARLCAEAKDGQILIAQRVAVAVGESIAVEEIGTLTLKGLTQPVLAFNVLEQRGAGGSAEIVSLPLRGREVQ